MVQLNLWVELTTENIRGLVIKLKEFQWIFQISCKKCFTPCEKEICFYSEDEVPLLIKGTCNFVKSCQSCKNEMRITIMKETNTPIELQDGNNKGRLVSLDLNGCKIEKWIVPQEGFYLAVNDYDDKFKVEEFTEDESWCDYHEETQQTLVIENFKSSFEQIIYDFRLLNLFFN